MKTVHVEVIGLHLLRSYITMNLYSNQISYRELVQSIFNPCCLIFASSTVDEDSL